VAHMLLYVTWERWDFAGDRAVRILTLRRGYKETWVHTLDALLVASLCRTFGVRNSLGRVPLERVEILGFQTVSWKS
jgi:hypothetical protein